MLITFEGIEIDLAKKEASSSKYGIEALTKVAVDIVKVWKKLKERADSGKGLNFWEKVRTGIEVSSLGAEVVSNLEILKDEIIDLQPEEAQAVAEEIAMAFGVTLTEAFNLVANIVVKSIEVVLAGIEIYKNVKKL